MQLTFWNQMKFILVCLKQKYNFLSNRFISIKAEKCFFVKSYQIKKGKVQLTFWNK